MDLHNDYMAWYVAAKKREKKGELTAEEKEEIERKEAEKKEKKEKKQQPMDADHI